MGQQAAHLLGIEGLDAKVAIELFVADLDVALTEDIAEELAHPACPRDPQAAFERHIEHHIDVRKIMSRAILTAARRITTHADVDILAIVLPVHLGHVPGGVHVPVRVRTGAETEPHGHGALLPL